MKYSELKPLPRTFEEMGGFRYNDYTSLTWLVVEFEFTAHLAIKGYETKRYNYSVYMVGKALQFVDAIEALGYNPHHEDIYGTEDYELVSKLLVIWKELVSAEY